MPSVENSLKTKQARDLMQSDLVQLYPDSSIADAVETFEEYHIGGAPVVDSAGNLVGVLTASDIVRSGRIEESPGGMEVPERESSLPDLPEDLDSGFTKEDYSLEVLGRRVVGDWMTTEVTTVAPDLPVAEVCGIMARNRIHRVFVTEKQHLVGVISTFDIVGHVAAAAQS